ncbi:MAG: sensor histidine kinase [Actinomycetaceae bacterium]|nr:sensor histidine kinase [Actinomycetaceae bacterium]
MKQVLPKATSEGLSDIDIDWLHMLQADWQALSDLAGADLILWLPDSQGGFVAAAHCRPATSATVHLDDVVGLALPSARVDFMSEVFETATRQVNPQRRWTGLNTVSEILVPVVRDGRAIAVMARESTSHLTMTSHGQYDWYQQASDLLCRMVSEGTFPYASTPTGGQRGTPRVSDGVVRLDQDGVVLQTSPNAISAFRRLGIRQHLVDKVLVEQITNLQDEQHRTVDETLAVVAMGRASWLTEIEIRGVCLTLRALPLFERSERSGALLLVRDVTELRRRERELMTKDATIREIHHRVKNNLQTVSALLRLQARRSDSQEVKDALGEAERRVATIATVHEALSHNVDESVAFDEIITRLLVLAATAASADQRVTTSVKGSFGDVEAGAAAALGVVLTEIVTNAVEHGLAERDGHIEIEAIRNGQELTVHVRDDGVGIPEGRASSGLGTQIVGTLVRGELNGTIEWNRLEAPEHGTDVVIRALMVPAAQHG